MKRSSMYIQKSDSEDLQTSGSGYSYQIHSGEPYSYTSVDNDPTGKLDDFPANSPQTFGRRYSHHPLPLHLLPLTPNFLPGYSQGTHDSYGKPLVPYAKGFDNFLDAEPQNGFHHGLQSTSFIKGGGSDYQDADKAIRGEKGESGYSNRDEYEKGLKGQHSNEQRKGYYGITGGKRQGEEEVAGHYARGHQAAKASRGGSFANKKGHDKGEKTTGYHKIFHKDEYKKDHSFYDKADKNGHFNRYGDFDAKQSAREGAYKKGGQHDKGFKTNEYGAKGFSDKGRFIDEDRGYKNAKGNDKYYKNYADFAEKGGKQAGVVKGYSEDHKFGQAAE